MHIEDASALISPLLPLHRVENVAEADWMRSFVLSRLCLLALAFAALPLAFAIEPQAITGSLSIFAAAVVSATAGLVALIFVSPTAALGASALGLCVLAAGPLTGDASLGAGIAALIALGCDRLAAPVSIRSRRWLTVVMSGAGAVILAASFADLPESPAASLASLIPILFAPLCTLALCLAALRERLSHQEKISHQQLSRSEGFVDAADVAVLFADRAGIVLDANPAAGALLSGKPEDIAGRNFFDRVLIADRPAFLKATSDAAVADSASTIRVRIAAVEASAVPSRPPRFETFDLSVRPAPGRTGNVVICMVAGVLPQQGSLRDRSELLQTVTHEIRTPMNAILGFSEVLFDPKAMPQRPEQVADYARIIHRSAREAFVITRALADLMRIEDKSFSPAPEVVSLRDVAKANITRISGDKVSGDGSANPGSVDFECDPGELDIVADPRLCQIILSSLLEGLAAHAGADERISLSIRRDNTETVVRMSARNPVAGAAGGTFFGVIDALCREAAARCGAACTLTFDADTVSAALIFASVPPVVALRPAMPHPFLSENLSSLRKSA